jgi:hypothetical protein
MRVSVMVAMIMRAVIVPLMVAMRAVIMALMVAVRAVIMARVIAMLRCGFGFRRALILLTPAIQQHDTRDYQHYPACTNLHHVSFPGPPGPETVGTATKPI